MPSKGSEQADDWGRCAGVVAETTSQPGGTIAATNGLRPVEVSATNGIKGNVTSIVYLR